MAILQQILRWLRDHPIVVAALVVTIAAFNGSPDLVWSLFLLFGLAAWAFYRHPFWAIPVFFAVMLLVEEFYPFSHFPMYGDPDESENYFYVAEVVDPTTNPPVLKPLPVETITRITAPKVKKMFKSWRNDAAEELGIKEKEMTPEQLAAVGRDLITYLRERDDDRPEQLPDSVALVEVWIEYDGAHGFTETTSIVVYDPPVDSLTKTP